MRVAGQVQPGPAGLIGSENRRRKGEFSPAQHGTPGTAKKACEQIRQQIAALQVQADLMRRNELDEVIARIRKAIALHGITAADLGLDGRLVARKRAAPGKKMAAKAVAAATAASQRDGLGREWRGRGKRPPCLRDALASGRSLDGFRVESS